MECIRCFRSLPADARFCPACGSPAGEPQASGKRKLVTVVFCDLVGSTPLSEMLDPETLRSVILRYYAAMQMAIEEFGGTVEKFIGDAVMAVFGVPVMHEDDARRAAAAALGMLDALADLNADLEPTLGVRLRVRIGVHTGIAVTSTDVSTRQAMVSGETVNIAARLEQNAGEGQILIGPLTREAIGAAARTQAVGPLRLKGKEAPVLTYRLLALEEDAPDLVRRFDLPFIGRRQELARLDRVLAEVTRGGPRVVVACGEPGIGKTRLVRTWLAAMRHRVLHGGGRCRPYGEHGSLAPLADAVYGLLAASGDGGADETGALAVLKAGLLSGGTPGPSLEGTCSALAQVLGEFSRDLPVVVTLDDCQWAGDLLLDVAGRLTEQAADSRVLFICLSRTDLLDRWPAGPAVRPQVLGVPRLSATECEALAGAAAEVTTHFSGGGASLFDTTGGNPFHIEQLLAAAGDGAVPAGLPPGLQALLGARIDALKAGERKTLDLAAILGREFAPQDLFALADAGPEGQPGQSRAAGADTALAALSRLRQRLLIEPVGESGFHSVLRFSSGLIHEATYQAMTKQTRADRHERAADILDDRHGADVTIATHVERAYQYRVELGLRDDRTDFLRRRAADHLGSLGEQALNRSDLEWARSLLGRALALHATGEPGWIRATRLLGEVAIATGGTDAGAALLRSMLDQSQEPVETAFARLALAVAGYPVMPGAAPATAADVARETLPVFEFARDELGQARASIRLAQEEQMGGRHVDAVALLGQGLDHAVASGAEPELAVALGAMGISLWRGPTQVPAAIERCRVLLAQHGAPRPTVRITLHCPLAVLLALDDRWDEARAALDVARRCADDLAYAEGEAVLPMFRAAVESLAGRHKAAFDLLDQAAGAAQRIGAASLHSAIVRESARLLLDVGRDADAAAALAALAPAPGLLRSDMADLMGLRGRVAAARGEATSALELVQAAVSSAAATDSPVVQANAAMDQAEVLARAGQPQRAALSATMAQRYAEGKGDRPGARRATQFLARVSGDSRSPCARGQTA